MGQRPGAGRDRLSRRQRRDLDRLEQELVADVHLCRWFDRLASDEPAAPPGRDRRSAAGLRAGRSPACSSQAGAKGVTTSAMFGKLVLAGAALTIAGGVLDVPTLAVLAVIMFILAPVSVLVAQGSHGSHRRRGGPATRPGQGAGPGLPPAGRSRGGMGNRMEGGMWLLP